MSDSLDDRALALLAAMPDIGPARLVLLVDRLVDEHTDRAAALDALRRAEHRVTVHDIDLRTGDPWRLEPALVPVVLEVDDRVLLEIELEPVPTATRLSWRQGAEEPRPASVEWLLVAYGPDAPSPGEVPAAVAALAVAIRQWEVGVPFAAVKVVERAADIDRSTLGPSADAARAHLVERASLDVERALAAFPVEVLRRFDGLRDAIGRCVVSARSSWPEGAALWARLQHDVPAGSDEPDDGDDIWHKLKVERAVVPTPTWNMRTAATYSVGGRVRLTQVHHQPPRVEINAASGGHLVTIALDNLVSRRLLRFLQAHDVAVDGDDPLRLGLEVELAWWRLRVVALLEHWNGPPPAPSAEALMPTLRAVAYQGWEEAARTPLGLNARTTAYVGRLPAGTVYDSVVIERADREPTEVETHALADRLLAERRWELAASAYEAVYEMASRSDLDDEGSTSKRALAAAKASFSLRQAGVDATQEQRLADLALGLNEHLARAVLDQQVRSIDLTRAIADLTTTRRSVAIRAEQLLANDVRLDLVPDLRTLGGELDAIDRAILARPTLVLY